MGITMTTTVPSVDDPELAVAWYLDLFGREPDRRPMEPSAELAAREIVLEPHAVPSGQSRLAELTDPSGDTVTFAQDL
jgi:hypothetical protein